MSTPTMGRTARAMFTRLEIQNLADAHCDLPHDARVLTPFSFELRPRGIARGSGGFQVLVEQAHLQIKVGVVPDRLAVGLRSAVTAGARANPKATQQLEATLAELGWTPLVRVSRHEFLVRANRYREDVFDENLTADLAVRAAAAMSTFVLNQLIVTRTVGEMRPATERLLGDADEDSDPWEYDPNERDRSTRRHRALENWLMQELAESGIETQDPMGPPFFDLAWQTAEGLFVCEVKSSENSEVHQLRLGLGQVLHYRRQLETGIWPNVFAALLIEREPRDALWIDLCDELGVTLFWPKQNDSLPPMLLGTPTDEREGPRNGT